MAAKRKKLILLDGNAIIHRAFHALPPLTRKNGEQTNAVYGFALTLFSVIDRFKPDYVIACFDKKGPTFRHEEFTEYKAKRVKAPDELYAQIPRTQELVKMLGIPAYEKDRYEADDLIGTIAHKLGGKDIDTIIVTGDGDTLQLVDDDTKVYTMRKGIKDTVLYDEKGVEVKMGVRPDQIADYKGLRGDSSDNIPGVAGVGEKTAVELLNEYETLENVYEKIDSVKETVRKKLVKDKDNAFLSKKLGTIDVDAPIDINIEESAWGEYDKIAAENFLKDMEFYSLLKRLPGADGAQSPGGDTESKSKTPKKRPKKLSCVVYEADAVAEFMGTLKKDTPIAVSVSYDGTEYFTSTVTGVTLYDGVDACGFIPITDSVPQVVKDFLEDDGFKKVGFRLKDEYKVLQHHGVLLSGVLFDSEIAAYMLNAGSKVDLESSVLTALGEQYEPKEHKKQMTLDMDMARSVEEDAAQAGEKIRYIHKLYKHYKEELEKASVGQDPDRSLEHMFLTLEMPIVKVLAEMEIAGVYLNKETFKTITAETEKEIKKLEKKIYDTAGKEFNINSTVQLREVLFGDLKIPTEGIKKTKTGYSTASSELQKLKKDFPIAYYIEDYRELFKLKTTYLDTLPTMTDDQSRLHTTFNQAVAATGRLSSADPNLQNIPTRTELGKRIRTAFEAPEGWTLVSADYSQIDLRCLAHLSGDEKMTEAFLKGEDIHRRTASEVHHIAPEDVDAELRRQAKVLNFGIVYGMGTYGFAQAADVSTKEAKDFIEKYFQTFSGAAAYLDSVKEFARKNGFVETELGRRRFVPEINASNQMVKAGAERIAINMPIQGLTADIMKLAMLAVEELITKNFSDTVRSILQVHDELIFEVKNETVETFSKEVKKTMEGVYTLSVPLVSDTKSGPNWGALEG